MKYVDVDCVTGSLLLLGLSVLRAPDAPCAIPAPAGRRRVRPVDFGALKGVRGLWCDGVHGGVGCDVCCYDGGGGSGGD